jgi:hypothetical protein
VGGIEGCKLKKINPYRNLSKTGKIEANLFSHFDPLIHPKDTKFSKSSIYLRQSK